MFGSEKLRTFDFELPKLGIRAVAVSTLVGLFWEL